MPSYIQSNTCSTYTLLHTSRAVQEVADLWIGDMLV